MPLLEQVLKKYPKKVKLAFKNFPIRRHQFSMKAAKAALVAQIYGEFWEFHDQLFENYRQLSDKKIKEIARNLGLDQAEFEKEMKDPALLAIIRQDMQDGRNAGVTGTPSIFVNGRSLKHRTLEGFQSLIEKELKKLEKSKRETTGH